MSGLQQTILDWFDENARELPWRSASATPWAVMISEFMLQQTPVARVLPQYEAWLDRWPTPADLAAAPSGEAVRAWGRLGYPRRALRLHAAAVAIVERHRGEVPASVDELRALPGVGEYTAAAIASFAFGQRHPVLDTNVRRVIARTVSGRELPPVSLNNTERALAASLIPDDEPALWAVAVMEFGALVCTATSPRCGACPVRELCRWQQAGCPPDDGPPRRAQEYAGTDRQCRGRLLAVLRDADGTVSRARLDAAWAEPVQRERALASLVADGLAIRVGDRYALPD